MGPDTRQRLYEIYSNHANHEYCTYNPTFFSFLKGTGIVNEDSEFIEENEDEEDIDEIY